MGPIRVSASRLKTLNHCTLEFYYQEILKLPSKVHNRTAQGSCIHSLFECLMSPRRRKTFIALMENQTSVRNIPSLPRFIRAYDRRHGIAPYEMSAMLDMLDVAFLGIRRHFVDASGKWSPPPAWFNEKRFQIKVGEAVISGFIDLLIVWPDRVLVIDLKSQKARFTKDELANNIQGILYQLATEHEYHLIPVVDFIMLRHPPTPKDLSRHIQRFEATSETHLAGLRSYIDHSYGVVNRFGMKEAMSAPTTDSGFCRYVCQYLKSFDYWSLSKKATPHLVLATFPLDKPPQVGQDEVLTKMHHAGCAAHRQSAITKRPLS